MDQKISDLDIKIAMEATDIIPVVDSNGDNKAINGAQVKDFVGLEVDQDIDAVKDMISDEYDNTATYAVGDYCIYNNTLYKCSTAIDTPEDFDPDHWDNTSISDEIGRIDTAKADKSYVDYSVNLGQGTYNGIYWIVREFYSFYLVEVVGTATTTFNWHTLVSVNKAYAPTMQRKVPISSYDHNYFRGSIGFNNGNIELKVDEAAYVCGQFILPKDLT